MSSSRRDHSRAINPQLLQATAWLLHRDKQPYYSNGTPRRGKLDVPADLAKLATYEAALATLNGGGQFTGLGIAINRGLQFIDLDKVRDPKSGRLVKWARALQQRAVEIGAYVEVSMSGTGIHIVGHGGEIPTHKSRHIETYCHGRYMAVGRKVLSTGTDPLPDLGPVLALMDLPSRPKPELRLVGKPAARWPVERHVATECLKGLNPDMLYPDWINVGMALHDASGGAEDGLILWDTWSAEGVKYEEGECARMWFGFKAGGGITMGTLRHMARQAEETVSSPVTLPRVSSDDEMSHDELMARRYPPVVWFVDHLIRPGLTLLAAPPKAGKSYFVLQMALCVGSGKPFLGLDTHHTKVTYFDLEEWPELLQERCRHVARAHHVDRTDVRYVLKVTSEGVMRDMQRHIDSGSKLIIIDLFARVRDEVSEDAKQNVYARDYAALSKFSDFVLRENPGVAIVMVHHTNKGTHEDWQNQISGSHGLAGASHTNVLLGKISTRNMDDESKKNADNYKRLQVIGKGVKPLEMMLVKMENDGGWEVSTKSADDVRMQSKHAHILQVLRDAAGAWMTAKQISEHVEGTLDSIKKMLLRMAQKGEIQSSGSGGAGYRLKP